MSRIADASWPGARSLLAVVEMTGSNAEKDAVKANVDASVLWDFYQAKSIRQTTLRAEAERLKLGHDFHAAAPGKGGS